MLLLVAGGCTSPAPAPKSAPRPPAIATPVAPPAPVVQTATLIGLYEGAPALRRNQMCMIERSGRTSFAMVVWGAGERSCSGSGRAVRQGDRLLLTMEGESSCILDARISGGRVILPGLVPQSCAYYCGEGAQLGGATFDKTGGTQGDALRATDLAGDPLCG